MTALLALTKRNTKLFFKDKGLFFTSLITPLILLVLYVTFLGRTFRDALLAGMPAAFRLSDSLADGFVAGQLISSLLAVSCVTVAFCSNVLMVQDKVNGTRKDLGISPVPSATLSMSYYLASLLSTLIICVAAMGICLAYAAVTGWYFTAADLLWMLLDIFLLTLFGTALSSLINVFLSTQGQISAVGTIVSAGYGFICGAYMPISGFSEGLQKVISFLPGTYGTALIRRHTLRGVFAEIEEQGTPGEIVRSLEKSVDCRLEFFGNEVSVGQMYLILSGSVAVLIALYVCLHCLKHRRTA